MMTKDEKKELFLLIIETWFNDKSGQINTENCIGFYHYFIDCLEFEIQFSPEYEPGFHKFLSVVVSFLIDFPSYHNYVNTDQNGLKSMALNSVNALSAEQIESFSGRVIDLYITFREEYLL